MAQVEASGIAAVMGSSLICLTSLMPPPLNVAATERIELAKNALETEEVRTVSKSQIIEVCYLIFIVGYCEVDLRRRPTENVQFQIVERSSRGQTEVQRAERDRVVGGLGH